MIFLDGLDDWLGGEKRDGFVVLPGGRDSVS